MNFSYAQQLLERLSRLRVNYPHVIDWLDERLQKQQPARPRSRLRWRRGDTSACTRSLPHLRW
jgi:hypothetical protein